MIPYFLNSNSAFAGDVFKRSDALFSKIFSNTGNACITDGMLRQMGGSQAVLNHSNSTSNLFLSAVDAEECARINRDFTHVFLTLQDHIREDFDDRFYENACATLKRITLPVIASSLGANSMGGYDRRLHQKLSPMKKLFLSMLAERCITIGVRGEYSASVLDKLGIKNHTIIGCPSYFTQGSARAVSKKPWQENALVGATGDYTHAQQTQLYYLLQDELIVSKLLYFSDPLTREDFDHFSAPMLRNKTYWENVTNAVAQERAGLFADMETWRTLIQTKLHFVIGSRLHGAIMAFNAGIPAIVTNNDARATETASFLHIPHYPLGRGLPNRLEAIYEQIDPEALNKAYAPLYQNFRDWLAVNQVPSDVWQAADAPAPAAMLERCSIAEQSARKQQLDALRNEYAWQSSTFLQYVGRILRKILRVGLGSQQRAFLL